MVTTPLDADARARFEALALPHLPDVYRLAVRLKGRAQDAEDLVQETYVKALRAFPSLRQPDRVRPWLFQILSRLVLDQQRAEPREVATGDLEELDRFSSTTSSGTRTRCRIPTTCTVTFWPSSPTTRSAPR